MVLAPYFLLLSGCVWWTVSRANPRDPDEAFPFFSEENTLMTSQGNGRQLPVLVQSGISNQQQTAQRHQQHPKQPVFLGDYDVIEVIQNGSLPDYGEQIGFSAVKERFCAAECIRGLSGLCICPPPDTSNVSVITTSRPPTPSFTRHTHHRLHRQRTNKKGDSHFALSASRHPLPLQEEPSRDMRAAKYLRVKRGDDDDEEDQKLCKCRRCRKLFKRTLYCRVFPCYQKKCKSGEWRPSDRESTPSSAH